MTTDLKALLRETRLYVNHTLSCAWHDGGPCTCKYFECRDRIDAALAQPEAEPVAWGVFGDEYDYCGQLPGGFPHFIASYREACHEHINDAINEHKITEAATWRVVPLYARPPEQAVPEGFVLVPKEPTEAMVLRGNDLHDSGSFDDTRAVYAAMLSAAPRPEGAKP